MPKYTAEKPLTATLKRSGLDNNPLRMRSRIGIGETEDLSFLIVH